MSATARRRGAAAALDHALLVLPFAATIGLAWSYWSSHNFGVDFEQEYWVVGMRILHGLDPYAAGWQHIAGGVSFPYPAAAGLLFVPFAELPRGSSDAVFVGICIAALIAALRVLDVRDWRVYSVAFLWFPVINAWQSGNVTLLLCLGLAATWRYRDRPIVAGLLAATLISVKPFVWPVLVWLIATRRFTATAAAAAIGVLINALSWLIIGTGEIHAYLHVSSEVATTLYRSGYGAIALAAHLGMDRAVGTALLVGLSCALAVACLIAGLRGGERASFTLAVALMLVASPLVWNHYFALLIVPLAIALPRLAPLWVLPLLTWLCPATHVSLWQVTLAWGVSAALVIALLRLPAGPARNRAPALIVAGRRTRSVGLLGRLG